jgi:hypothetical protein
MVPVAAVLVVLGCNQWLQLLEVLEDLDNNQQLQDHL